MAQIAVGWNNSKKKQQQATQDNNTIHLLDFYVVDLDLPVENLDLRYASLHV